MLVKYKGRQSAMTIGLGSALIRLLPNANVLLTKAQADEFQARPATKKLVKAKVLEITSLDSLGKEELVAVAVANGHKLKGKEKVADLIAILSDADDDADEGDGDIKPDDKNDNQDPAE